uniref:Uncharacterized protein n=1 Tax=Hanusia phi TaxID=3032 RepID=A0A7S0EE36_9CRYP|mmetsp:Transcript_22625/g.50969  ORF Transcript_22625/g.50969 Transcript_22625/m.50969 type:complete len:152 (+) Transcript_22625:248-703(+)
MMVDDSVRAKETTITRYSCWYIHRKQQSINFRWTLEKVYDGHGRLVQIRNFLKPVSDEEFERGQANPATRRPFSAEVDRVFQAAQNHMRSAALSRMDLETYLKTREGSVFVHQFTSAVRERFRPLVLRAQEQRSKNAMRALPQDLKTGEFI